MSVPQELVLNAKLELAKHMIAQGLEYPIYLTRDECDLLLAAEQKLAAQSADAARLREGIEDAMQRANETRTGSMAFQDTVFAMHAILKAALSAPEGT
jgi:hypothetical protein